MKKIQLWSVEDGEGKIRAAPVEDVDNTETEQRLEDLLVSSPDLLMNGLTLIGRQVPTEGGPLDLLGIDTDGGIVVFELKRGTLTRDAIAQILDYASYLATVEDDKFARLIEENSGKYGIEQFEDFSDWYNQEYPNEAAFLAEPPRMVLVGLGVDERARRIVNFLADTGIDIQLLTFHAFRRDGKLFLARQIETTAPAAPRGSAATQTKEGNRKILLETAETLGVTDFLEEAKRFIQTRLPTAYCWPGKTSYSFSLPARTSEGRPTLRVYVTVYLQNHAPGTLSLVFPPRAEEVAAAALDEFGAHVPNSSRNKNNYSALEVGVDQSAWGSISAPLDGLLRAIVAGWKQLASEGDAVEEDDA